MEKLFFLAFVAFCNPFGLVAAKVSQIAECDPIMWLWRLFLPQKYEFHYLGTEAMNETNDFFSYEVKSVDKFNESVFIVNVESDLKVVMNNDWHVSINITVDHQTPNSNTPLPRLPSKSSTNLWTKKSSAKSRSWLFRRNKSASSGAQLTRSASGTKSRTTRTYLHLMLVRLIQWVSHFINFLHNFLI